MTIAADNHYAPRHYLRAWSPDGVRVLAYPILVPGEDVPKWKLRPIRAVAKHAHLYTSILGGILSDEFERWMADAIEQPAVEAIERIRSGRQLVPADWRRLATYVAALDRRTPAAYLEHMKFYQQQGPETLSHVLDELKNRIARGERFSVPAVGDPPIEPKPGQVPMRLWTEREPGTDRITIHVEIIAGREVWLQDVRRVVESTSKVLSQHRWIVLRPPSGAEWFTSDHPVVRLNYYGPGRYDFGGG